jgi:hypothetical protein
MRNPAPVPSFTDRAPTTCRCPSRIVDTPPEPVVDDVTYTAPPLTVESRQQLNSVGYTTKSFCSLVYIDRNVLDQDYSFPTEPEANPDDIPLLTPKMSPSSLAFSPAETTRTLLLIRSANNVHLFTNIITTQHQLFNAPTISPRTSCVRVSIYIDVCPLVLFYTGDARTSSNSRTSTKL